MGYIDLAGEDWRRLPSTLQMAFNARALEALVLQYVPKIANDIAFSEPLSQVSFALVQTANQHGVLDKLLTGAAEKRPSRPDLRQLVLDYSRRPGWAVRLADHEADVIGALEKLTSLGNPFIDVARMTRWLIALEGQVCQVRCGTERGTGFLVAEDLVLTCYHVVQEHLSNAAVVPRSEVKVRFDYRASPNGTPPEDKDTAWEHVHETWEIPSSTHSKADTSSMNGDPAPNELDFAFLKLRRPAGSEPGASGEGPRGWVDLSVDPVVPEPQAPILIVQHPGPTPQKPLKIAFATPGFDGLNANGTRLIHRVSTERGSSGSPIFDGKLSVVALHQAVQPNSTTSDPAKNQGIPLARIRGALDPKVRELLTKPPG